MPGQEPPHEDQGSASRPRLVRQVSGVWVAQLILLLIQVAYTAVTSRTITAQGFAAYAIALTVVGVVSVVTSTWLANAAARRLTDDLAAERALVTVALLVGFSSLAAVLASGAWIADVLRNPDAAPLIRLLSVNLLVAPLTGVLSGYLRREGRIAAIALGQVVLTALASAVGVLLVLVYQSAWTLTASTVLFGYAFALLVVWLTRERAVPGRSIALLRDDLAFAVKSLGFVILGLFNSFGPVLVLGRYTTADALAAYNRAQVVWRFPFETATRGALTVLYPHFRTMQLDGDTRRVASLLLAALGWICLGPLIALAPAAPVLTGVILGDGWSLAQSMAPFLWVSGGFGLFTAMFAGALEPAGFMRTLRAPAAWGAAVLGAALIVAGVSASWAPVVLGVCVAPILTHVLQLFGGSRLGLINLKLVSAWYLGSLVFGAALAGLTVLIGWVVGFPGAGLAVSVSGVFLFMYLSWHYRAGLQPLDWAATELGKQPPTS